MVLSWYMSIFNIFKYFIKASLFHNKGNNKEKQKQTNFSNSNI